MKISPYALMFFIFSMTPSLNATDIETVARKEMRAISEVMRTFRIFHHKYPKGNNSDIVRQLKSLKEFNINAARLDKDGNMLDPFGIPYIFLFSQKDDCVIASIGNALYEKNMGLIEFYPVNIEAPKKSQP